MPVIFHSLLYGVLHVGWGLVQPARRAVIARARVELKSSAVWHVSKSSDDQLCANVVFGQLITEKLVETLAMDLTSLKNNISYELSSLFSYPSGILFVLISRKNNKRCINSDVCIATLSLFSALDSEKV